MIDASTSLPPRVTGCFRCSRAGSSPSTDAARHYADLAVAARKAGKGFPTPDGYIAAIATAHGFTVATRDASAFNAAVVPMIAPGLPPLSKSARILGGLNQGTKDCLV